NLFDQIGNPLQSQNDSNLFQTTGSGRLRYAQNTFIKFRNVGGRVSAMGPGKVDGMEFYGNIVPWGSMGFYSDVGGGNLWNAIDSVWLPNYAMSRNVVVNNQHLQIYGRPSPVANLQLPSDVSGQKACASCAVPENMENGGNDDVG